MRLNTDFLTNGIPPDIRSDIFDGVRWAKNVVVVARFPETAAVGLLKFEASVLFEETDKFTEIGAVVNSLREDVDVIRHCAICVKSKRMAGGAFEKEIKDALGVFWDREMRRAVVTANCYEIGLPAKIIFGG